MSSTSTVSRWTFGPVARTVRRVLQRVVLFPVVGFLSPVTVRGKDGIKRLRGPVIIAANHVSHLDTPVILKALPSQIRRRLAVVAAKDYFYSGRIRGAVVSLALAAVPFDRHGDSRGSLEACETLIGEGWSLLVFPEGTRSQTGSLGRVRRGVAVMSVRTRTPVLPVYVHGLTDVLPKGSVAPLPGGVVVEIGDLLPAGSDVDAVRDQLDQRLRDLADRAPEWGSHSSQEGG